MSTMNECTTRTQRWRRIESKNVANADRMADNLATSEV